MLPPSLKTGITTETATAARLESSAGAEPSGSLRQGVLETAIVVLTVSGRGRVSEHTKTA